MNTSSIIILFSIRKIYYILRKKSTFYRSTFFYFRGYIIKKGGVSIFFSVARRRKQQPLPQGRGFVAKRVFARSNKRGGRADKFSLPSHPFSLKNSDQNRRKRNKPLQSDDFPSLCLSVREKFLKWCQTHLEEGFWTLQRKVLLPQFHF